MLKTDALRVFLAIAKTQHVGLAAKALRLTPSATSHALAALESALGTPLFERVGRGIVINAAGRLFETKAHGIMLQLEELERSFVKKSDQPRGMFRIAATHSLAVHWVAPATGILLRRFPEVSLDVCALSSREAQSRIESHEADFAVTYDDDAVPGALRIHSGAVVPVVSTSHPLLKLPEAERWHNLASYPLAVPRSIKRGQIGDLAIAEQVERHASQRLVFDSYETAIRFLQTSDGWSFFPEWFTDTQLGKLAVLARGEVQTPYVIHLRLGPRADTMLGEALATELLNFARPS